VIETYHRPSTLEQALSLLEAEGTVVLGGGTSLVAAGGPSAVVDLQDLGLDAIATDGDRVTIGAMARLREVADSDLVPQMLRELARREAPNTIRNAATIGGTVATADPESELVAGMLVYDAMVTITDANETTMGLDEYLVTRPPGIITGVSLATGGVADAARTGRTPADRPIVMAVARRDQSGRILLALTGVASAPLLIDTAAIPSLDPPADFRGSAEYRRHLAVVLGARAIAGLDQVAKEDQ
jgi:probable selenate reductase FAD-binding subunit